MSQVLSGITELGFEPNADSMNILIKAYASVGDIDQAMKVLDKCGSNVRTSEVNSALSAVVQNPSMDHWDKIVSLHAEYFMSEKLVADDETYEQFLLCCGKYGRSDDALFWFEDFLSTGRKVTNTLRRAFRAAVDESVYNEHPQRFFYDVVNLDATLLNYRQLLLATAAESESKTHVPSFVGSTTELYELLQQRAITATNSAELKSIVERHVNLGDLVGARQTISMAATGSTYPDAETVLVLMAGYASHGDFVRAESLFEDARHHGATTKGDSSCRFVSCRVVSSLIVN